MEYCRYFGLTGMQLIFNDLNIQTFKSGLSLLSNKNDKYKIEDIKEELRLISNVFNNINYVVTDPKINREIKKTKVKIGRTEEFFKTGKPSKLDLYKTEEELEEAKLRVKTLEDSATEKYIENSFVKRDGSFVKLSPFALQLVEQLDERFKKGRFTKYAIKELNELNVENREVFDRAISYYLSNTNTMRLLLSRYRSTILRISRESELVKCSANLKILEDMFDTGSSEDSSYSSNQRISYEDVKERNGRKTRNKIVLNEGIRGHFYQDFNSNTGKEEYTGFSFMDGSFDMASDIAYQDENGNDVLKSDLIEKLLVRLYEVRKLDSYTKDSFLVLLDLFIFANSINEKSFNEQYSFYIEDDNGNKKQVELDKADLISIFNELEEIGLVGLNFVAQDLFLNSLEYINLEDNMIEKLDRKSELAKAVYLVRADLNARLFK